MLGLALDEFERRCSDPAYLATLSVDELRLVWAALSPYVLPRKYEHAGVDGGPVQLELQAARNAAATSFRERLGRLADVPGQLRADAALTGHKKVNGLFVAPQDVSEVTLTPTAGIKLLLNKEAWRWSVFRISH